MLLACRPCCARLNLLSLPKEKKKLRVLGAHFTDEEAEAQGAKEPKKGVLMPRNSGGETEHILREITGWWRKICHKEAAPGLMREIEFYPGYAASRMISTQRNPVGVSQSCGETSPCFGSPSLFVRAQTLFFDSFHLAQRPRERRRERPAPDPCFQHKVLLPTLDRKLSGQRYHGESLPKPLSKPSLELPW